MNARDDRRIESHCTEVPVCECLSDLLTYRDRLVSAAEEKNRHIRQLERKVFKLTRKRDALRTQLDRILASEEELPYKRRNGQLYAYMGRALMSLYGHDPDGAAQLLAQALAMTPEQLEDLSFKASLLPRHGSHPNGNHLKGPDHNDAVRKRIRPSQRSRIFDRDGRRCRMCGWAGDDTNPLTIDHVIPVARGGTNNDTNLQTLCATCNARKNKTDMLPGPPLVAWRSPIRRSFDP